MSFFIRIFQDILPNYAARGSLGSFEFSTNRASSKLHVVHPCKQNNTFIFAFYPHTFTFMDKWPENKQALFGNTTETNVIYTNNQSCASLYLHIDMKQAT